MGHLRVKSLLKNVLTHGHGSKDEAGYSKSGPIGESAFESLPDFSMFKWFTKTHPH